MRLINFILNYSLWLSRQKIQGKSENGSHAPRITARAGFRGARRGPQHSLQDHLLGARAREQLLFSRGRGRDAQGQLQGTGASRQQGALARGILRFACCASSECLPPK
jgi:hypothetical protein